MNTAPELDPHARVSMLETMVLARRYHQAAMSIASPASGHAAGDAAEAAQVGTALALALHDRLVVHHRRAAALLARGATLADLLAERLAPAGGWIGTRQGALHRWAAGHGVLLASTLAGSELAMAPGAALTQKAVRPLAGGVAAVLFDADAAGATRSGEAGAAALGSLTRATLEATAAAALPLLLVATTPADVDLPGAAHQADGGDVEAVYGAVRAALDEMRAGGRARLVQLRLDAGAADPLQRQTQRLLDAGITSAGELGAMHQRAQARLAAAWAAAACADAALRTMRPGERLAAA